MPKFQALDKTRLVKISLKFVVRCILMSSKCRNKGHLVPCYLNSVKLFLILSDQYHSLEQGQSRIAVVEVESFCSDHSATRAG